MVEYTIRCSTFDVVEQTGTFHGYRLKFVFSVCRLVSRRCHNISTIPSVVPRSLRRSGQADFPYIRLFGQLFRFLLSMSGQCSSILTLCIVSMFLLSRAINRGDLRSAEISRFTAKPLRLHWSPSLASASFGRLLLRWSAILGYYRFDPQCFTKNLWVLPMLAWLLCCRCPTRCCLRPRGAGYRSSVSLYPFRLRSHR